MARNFSNEDIRDAAGRVSSNPNTVVRSTRGTRDPEGRWQSHKERTARALVSDPDIYFYFVFLSSNAARKRGMDLSEKLGEMIINAEGRRFSQSTVSSDSSQGLATMSGILSAVVESNGSPSDMLIEQVKRECDNYAKQALLPNIRTGGRIQPRGEEASTSFSAAKATVSDELTDLYEFIRSLREPSPIPVSLIRPQAMKAPANSLRTTVNAEFPPERAGAYSLQVLASVAAIEAMNRPFDPFIRLRVSQKESFPIAKLDVEASDNDGSFVTALRVKDKSGRVIDPRTLGILGGDQVDWLGKSATILAVGPAFATLSDSEIPVGARGGEVSIEGAPGASYKVMRDQVNECLRSLPTTVQLEEALASLDAAGAAETRNLAKFLGNTANILHPLGDEPLKALERMDVEVSTPTPLSEILLSYSPDFRSQTRDAGTDILDSLESDGFDQARDFLLEGNLRDFMLISSRVASYSSTLDLVAGGFSDSLAYNPPPDSRGR